MQIGLYKDLSEINYCSCLHMKSCKVGSVLFISGLNAANVYIPNQYGVFVTVSTHTVFQNVLWCRKEGISISFCWESVMFTALYRPRCNCYRKTNSKSLHSTTYFSCGRFKSMAGFAIPLWIMFSSCTCLQYLPLAVKQQLINHSINQPH